MVMGGGGGALMHIYAQELISLKDYHFDRIWFIIFSFCFKISQVQISGFA